MSEELKPEPRIDKDGLRWCGEECKCRSSDGQFCDCTGEEIDMYNVLICLPAVRKMVAELERLKVENKKQTISYCKVCGKVLQEGEYRLIPGRGHICYRCCPLITTRAAKEN